MKQLILPFILFFSLQLNAQTDTTIHFKVFGVCGLCKERIETTVKVKGVSQADWDVDSHILALTYDPAQVKIEKIKKMILGAGHDLEGRKAPDNIYEKLPACCHYRDEDPMGEKQIANTEPVSGAIKGVVMETTSKGAFTPLRGATIIWAGTSNGVMTDSAGVFTIPVHADVHQLVISYTGYQADTITITDQQELKIILASGNQLKEVTVTAKQRSTYLSALNPMRTQIMTEKELFKAACCNLSESFETNPSVDVSYNDAVTGSKQIQLLGLAGAYTQLLVENLTGPRGIATPLGLNSIAGPWIESIQLTKGIGSVANGYESIAGQINVELKKPENSEKMYANAYINSQGKTDLNLNLSHKWAKKWSTALLLHDDFLSNKNMDENKDGFRDLPTGNQFSMINRWKYDNTKGFLMQFGFKILHDNRNGGETDFVPAKDKLTTNHYGLGIETSRYEAFAKIGYVFPEKKYKSIGLQLSAVSHKQDSYFGLSVYDARQQNFYANLIYQSIIGSTVHKFRTGLSFLHDHYDESLKSNRYLRTENIPGFFGEYTFTPSDKFSMIAGIRGDNHNLFGFFLTPRIHLRYEPVKGTTFRMSAGRGQRTASIFAENTSVLVSNRQVQIVGGTTGKAYGLDPEVAWNKGISLDQKMKLFHRDATLSFDFFRNDFKQQVVVDLENPQLVRFYNLTGKSYSNSFQAEMTLEPARNLELRLAYRYFDVKTTYGDKLLQRPLIAANRAFANVYYTNHGWKFDYTISLNGKKRIPYTGTNPHQYHLNDYSPSYTVMNAQISKTLGKKRPMDFYVGAENLTNYMQHHPILASEDPFGNYFDASMIWGPVNGGMVYVGWRWKIK